MALFSRPSGHTTLIVDIENSSVATALATFSSKTTPHLYAEHRVVLPVFTNTNAHQIAKKVHTALEEALSYTSEVAATLRQDPLRAPLGNIQSAHLFFGAPWVTTTFEQNRFRFLFEPEMLYQVHQSAQTILGERPIESHPFARSATHGVSLLTPAPSILCSLTGEVLEVLLVAGGTLQARATTPVGTHTAIRTISSHSDISLVEAASALRLHSHNVPFPVHREPIKTSEEHVMRHFIGVLEELLLRKEAENIFVVTPTPFDDWFARAVVAHLGVSQLFPHGGTTRILRSKHFKDHITLQSPTSDMPLLLNTLYLQTHLQK